MNNIKHSRTWIARTRQSSIKIPHLILIWQQNVATTGNLIFDRMNEKKYV